MIKERLIFWPLLAMFISILIFAVFSQGSKEIATEELMKEIELAKKRSVKRTKTVEIPWDIRKIKAEEKLKDYRSLLKRSPFFRVRPEKRVERAEPIPVKKEPRRVVLNYKGRVTMGSKVMVIIEDKGTGKSHFVQEGDVIGDFLVVSIDEKKVVLKKKGGGEVVLSAVKKEKLEEVKEEK